MTPNTKIFTDLLRESRAFLTVSAAEYGAGHNAAEAFRILPDSMLGVLVRHCETVSCAGGLLHLYGGGQLLIDADTFDGLEVEPTDKHRQPGPQ